MKRTVFSGEFFEKLEQVSLAMKGAMSGLFGGSRSAHGYGNTVEFADFREYVPGDDLRRIDWNVYARFEKYFIKLFTDERQLHNRIIVDCSASMESGKPEKAETALRIAAALGYLSVCAMDRVSFQLLHGDRLDDLCGTILGKDGVLNASLLLEQVEFHSNTEIDKAVLGHPNPGYDDGMTIIISDFLTESDWKSVVDFLIYRHREVVLIQILSPQEMNPRLIGDIHLIDSESDHPADPRNMKIKINKSFAKAYQQALTEYQNELREFCISRGASYIFAVTDEPLEQIIFEKGYETEIIR